MAILERRLKLYRDCKKQREEESSLLVLGIPRTVLRDYKEVFFDRIKIKLIRD